MKKKIIIGIISAAICSNTFATTNHTNQIYSTLGFGGYINNSHSASAPAVNAAIGYILNKNIDTQLNLNLFGNNQKTVTYEGAVNLSNDDSKIKPYITIGGGYTHFTTNSFGLNAGIGIKYEFAPNAFASVNYRYLQSFGCKTPNGHSLTFGMGVYLNSHSQNNFSSTENIQRDVSYLSIYKLPKSVKQCELKNSEPTIESKSCYTIGSNKVEMHLDSKFAYNSYALDNNSKPAIDNLLNFMEEYNINKVSLKGFSSKGEEESSYEEYNQKLSVNRAQSIKSYMVLRGLKAVNITVFGHGYNQPLVPNTNKENQLINQRVEAVICVPLEAK